MNTVGKCDTMTGTIKRSNIVRYCINNCRNSGRIHVSKRCWIHKQHRYPYLTPSGELWVTSFVNIFEKIDHVITAPHCIFIFHYQYHFGIPWSSEQAAQLELSASEELKPSRIRAPKPKLWTTLGLPPMTKETTTLDHRCCFCQRLD